MANYCYKILNECEIMQVIKQSAYCRLGVSAEGKTYVIPMAFECRRNGKGLTFHMMSEKTGKKMCMMKDNCNVCLEFDCPTRGGVCSVVALGIAKLEDKGNECVMITVCDLRITGRKYYFR